jgi:hypothetical protein
MATPVIRFLAGKKSPLGTLYLTCHVKPGASKAREGIISVSDDVIELCVSARAREGEANQAVVKLLSEVCSFLYFPPRCPVCRLSVFFLGIWGVN